MSVLPRLGLCALLVAGCSVRKPYPNVPVVESVEFEGVDSEYLERLREGTATHESAKLLGIWDGVAHDYEAFDESVLQADLERIRRFYRARGYYEATVRAARVLRTDEKHVRIQIRVEPGAPVITQSIELHGLEQVDIDLATQALIAVRVKTRAPFDEEQFEKSKAEIADLLADRGYAFAEVTGKAHVNLAAREAFVHFNVVPGRRAALGKVSIVGLKQISEKPVRSALQLDEGAPYSRSELKSAQRALFALGVFAQVRVEQDLTQPDTGKVPVTVHVTESALGSINLGFGARIDVLRTAAYGRAAWEHRNFLGDLRHFAVRERPGVTLFPTRIDLLRRPTKPLFENTLEAELRRPSFLEGRTTGWVKTAYNVFPLLYPLPEDVDPEQEKIIGYHEILTAAGADRTFFESYVPVRLSYNWQANLPLPYQIPRPDAGETGPTPRETFEELENVYVSFPQLNLALDLRDDPISPLFGLYAETTVQVANPLLFGTVSDVRVQPEIRTFYPLSRQHKVVLATRFKMGMVFPRNYGGTFDRSSALSDRLFADPEDPAVIADQQKVLFRAFYSGGPTSNRGYPFRRVGPQGPIGFLLPTGQNCTFSADRTLPSACIRPLGGFSLWEASMEIRFPLVEPFFGTLFLDASDVSTEVADFKLDRPHLSVGPGFRWMSPIGPVRLDVGYRIPGWQVRTDSDSDAFQDAALTDEFRSRLPFAYHIAIGEAF